MTVVIRMWIADIRTYNKNSFFPPEKYHKYVKNIPTAPQQVIEAFHKLVLFDSAVIAATREAYLNAGFIELLTVAHLLL